MMKGTARRSTANLAAGFGISLAAALLLNAGLVVLKESSPRVMAWMRDVTGHHWPTHALILLAAYLSLGLILARARLTRALSAAMVLALCTASLVVSILVIAGYYVWHALVR